MRLQGIRQHSDAPIVIAEGCGDASLETPQVFAKLGYAALAREMGARGLLEAHAHLLEKLETDDQGVIGDIDVKDDLR